MPTTHTLRTIRTSTTIAAATAAVGTEWNNSTAYGGIVTVRLTNGATAPTTAPVVQFFVGEATTVKRQYYVQSGDIVNSSVNDIVCEIPAGVMFVNVTITNGATNAITADAFAQELTTV